MSLILLRDLHQAAANLEAVVVTQHVWGARPGHRDELILRDRATGAGTSSSSDEPLDERLWCLMDYYDPTAIVNTEGEVVERYRFSAFGLRAILDPDFDPRAASHFEWDFAFKGQFLDLESGYYNYGYRYYSPQLGRWLSRDPIGERGGVNVYAMVLNNPTNLHDKFGLAEDDLDRCTCLEDIGKMRTKCEVVWTGGLPPELNETAKQVYKRVGARYGIPGGAAAAIGGYLNDIVIAALQQMTSSLGASLAFYYRETQEVCVKSTFLFIKWYGWEKQSHKDWNYYDTWILNAAIINKPSYTESFASGLDQAISTCQ
jgi:RHS repeat-associated protein